MSNINKKWNIGWGCTSKCNMNCQFCYSKSNRVHSTDLGLDAWISFVDHNHTQINSINYGTGENTLSGDWFKLIRYIRKNYPEIRQSLTTNGHLAEAIQNADYKEAFVAAIDEVDVSLDFADESRHCELRGQSRSYKWAIDTLKLCREYGKQATIVFLGSEVNLALDNIDGLFEIAKTYGAILRMNIYRPTDGIDKKSRHFIVSRETLLRAITHISKRYHVLSLGDSLLSPILCGVKRSDPSGNRSIRILSNGDITPSTYLIKSEYVIGNIQDPLVLKKIEDEERFSDFVYDGSLPKECHKCAYRDDCCGGVLDRRFLWYGSLSQKDPYCDGGYAEKIPPIITLAEGEFESVHDDYLPTMFFKP